MSIEADLTSRLAGYLSAESAILNGAQEYVIGQGATARRLTRANLAEVQAGITALRAELAQVQAAATSRRRVTYLRPF
ncbi:MAG: hypothetical protein EOO27_26470 [Comamonadaceae bacterium]|nr:MAG: hypothetical protein EOO27_26470 [Comamonadaceae bacterium]